MTDGYLHPEQFAQAAGQLPLFMSPQEIIDTVHKSDAYPYHSQASPREQWEHPHSGWGPHDSDPQSLRDRKLSDLQEPKYRGFAEHVLSGQTKPVLIELGKEGLSLGDGHHRLALHEKVGTPLIPVQHRVPFRLREEEGWS